MKATAKFLLVSGVISGVISHQIPLHEQDYTPDSVEELERKWGFEWGFGGVNTFAHLEHLKCLTNPDALFDIGVLGVPFDTAVSYRPGARFGPRAIRAASSRQTSFRSFNPRAGINPYMSWAKILDCGDIPVTPMDNAMALTQMTSAYLELGNRAPLSSTGGKHPKIISLGGDHSLALAALRGLKNVYKTPIAVLHFDAHLDTWHPEKYPSPWPSAQSQFNHGSMFWIASNEGLIMNGSSVHAGLRTRLSGEDWGDYEDDTRQGFLRISSDDIDDIGPKGVIDAIMNRMGTEIPVYLSVDIDVIDPGLAPGTGTPEAGGWTTRELIRILRGIEGLNVVGADIVEVAPAYDGVGEQTALAGAQVAYEILTSIVKRGLVDMGKVAEVPGRKNLVTKDEL
ncbi:Arginase/deacetylase [Glarea lozoyensis ATCC 20868]|uniref:Arginase/deacetylase n=1 Tax=Glarea lozoyensis (strain ATCC 20868 / MF5171) TaxID=1116229 RepID=S3DA24_GLAL2|nr:Arginase/deacetylase [Glarea lozoyensis ATCC 20868]EPE28806.1 Arginase/deacetylase [Glarea lozoyensis ATCC 20868]